MNKLLRGLTIGATTILATAGFAVPAVAAPTAPHSAFSAVEVEPTLSKLNIMVASDVHVLAEELFTANGQVTEDFQSAIDGDRKMMPQSQEIFTAYIDRVIERKPDVLLISGDLTKDGEIASHEYVAAQIQRAKDAVPGLIVYVTNGNHDINNVNHSRDYTVQPSVQAPFATPDDYARIYERVLNDSSITAKYELPAGAQAGRFSYVAQPAPGYTFIVLDGGKYTADNTASGTDSQETGGNLTPELLAWATEQIAAAEARGDVAVGMTHWGINEHFSYEPTILADYLIDDYKSVGQQLMDAGLDYIFTGHMHANDIAQITGEGDKRLVDIETGSLVTYPSPSRDIELSREIATDAEHQRRVATSTMDIHTDFGDSFTGLSFTDNLEAFGMEATGFEPGFLKNVIPGFINGYADQIMAAGGIEAFLGANWNDGLRVSALLGSLVSGQDLSGMSFADFKQHVLTPKVAELLQTAGDKLTEMGSKIPLPGGIGTLHPEAAPAIVNELFHAIDKVLTRDANGRVPLAQILGDVAVDLADKELVPGHTLLDLATYAYQTHLHGDEDSQPRPEWVSELFAKLDDGTLVNELLGHVIDNSYDTIINPLMSYVDTAVITNISGLKGYAAGTMQQGESVPVDASLPPLITLSGLIGGIAQQIFFDEAAAVDGVVPWKDDMKNLRGAVAMASNVISSLGIAPGFDVKATVTDLLRGLVPSDSTTGPLASLSPMLKGIIESMVTDENGTPDGNAVYVTTEFLPLVPETPGATDRPATDAPATVDPANPSASNPASSTPAASHADAAAGALAHTGMNADLAAIAAAGLLALAAGTLLRRKATSKN